MSVSASELTGKQKAAILLITLGPEISSNILKELKEEEIEQLTLEITNQRKVSQELKDEVISEFYEMCLAGNYISTGGLEYAQEVLEKALGAERALEIINKLTANFQLRPFDFIKETDPTQLLSLIQYEHPQTIALILAYIEPDKAAAVVSSLSPELQTDVIKRIATMDRTSPEVIRDVEKILHRKVSSTAAQDFPVAGGIQSVVEVIVRVDRGAEKVILENLEIQDPELADEIKKRLFVFEDIILIDDRSLQMVLREIDTKELSLALKGVSTEVANKVFKNMSKRASEMLKEEIDFMGPVRIRDVEEAQQKVVNVIRRLEESGEIVISRGKGDEIIA